MRRFGKYAVVEKIGEGGFGEVYLARDPVLGRDLAIKTCGKASAEDQQRFLREAQIAASLRHPNLVILHDFGFEGDEPYFVQEYLDGEDLDRKIKRRDNLSTSRKVEILLEAARGVGYAHDQGILHRDIKPSNVRIMDDGQVKVMDFGIAKIMNSDLDLTQTGVTMGTAGYIAPEHIRGETVGPEADIFAFGVLAYELLTYNRAFKAETLSAVLYRIVHEEPPALTEVWPSCPRDLAALVGQCMQKDPADRPRGFGAVVEALESLSSTELPDDLRMRSTESVVAPADFDPSMEFEKTTRTRSSFSNALQIFGRVRGRTLVAVLAAGFLAILILGPWGLPRLLDGPDRSEIAQPDSASTAMSQPTTPDSEDISPPIPSSTSMKESEGSMPPSATVSISDMADSSVAPASVAPREVQVPIDTRGAIALIATDATAAAHIQSSLSKRVERVLVYPNLAQAVDDRRAGRGADTALVFTIDESTGTSSAYGTQLSSCRVVVTVQHLALPDRALLFTSTFEDRGPECSEARAQPLDDVADAILVRLEAASDSVEPASLERLVVELALPLTSEDLDRLIETLGSVPGIRKVEASDSSTIELGVDREPGQVARDLDGLEELRIEKVDGTTLKARFLG